MTIKVKHILLLIFIMIFAIVLYKLFNEPIMEFLIKSKIEKQIVNNYNNNSFINVSEGVFEEYEYYKNYYYKPDIDITPLIESCIKQIETNERNPYSVGGLEVPLSSNFEREIQGYDYTDDLYVFYGMNRIASISELEKILIHKSNNKYSAWCISKDSSNIIELPYNFYLKYEPSDFKLLNKVKKITKCSFVDPVTYGYDRKNILIEYIDENDIKQSFDSIVYITKEDKYKISMFYEGLYFTESHNAKFELKNHIADLLQDEYVRRGYANDLTWDFDWEREECKEMVKTVKEKLGIK